MVNLHISRGELAENLIKKLADNSRNSRGLPGGIQTQHNTTNILTGTISNIDHSCKGHDL